jgi:hypothetical protein
LIHPAIVTLSLSKGFDKLSLTFPHLTHQPHFYAALNFSTIIARCYFNTYIHIICRRAAQFFANDERAGDTTGSQDTPHGFDALVSINTEPGLSCNVNGGLHSDLSGLRPKNKLTADYSDVAKPKS